MKITADDIECIKVFAYLNNMLDKPLEEVLKIMLTNNTGYKLPKDIAEYNSICYKLGLL